MYDAVAPGTDLFDAQTSGGLLIAVDPANEATLVETCGDGGRRLSSDRPDARREAWGISVRPAS